ncbi:anthranilate synthase component I [Sulfurisphaera ohwakuensis]|uniref:anthranilate synthase component I n=1 Tax=Sulfurisphaera ohwakuensis TaxID=69656 RepID=UPI0036F1CF11
MEIYPITSFAQPYEVFKCILDEADIAALLESGSGPQHKSRYSIIAWGKKGYLNITGVRSSGDINDSFYDPIEVLEKFLSKAPLLNLPGRFKGGIIGYVSYDAVRYWESIRDLKKEAEEWPNMEFFIPENVIVYDHIEGKVYVEGELPKVTICKDIGNVKFEFEIESLDKTQFEKAVSDILDYIKNGYAFQIVISRFLRYIYRGDLMSFYYNLRKINPSPYMYYLKFYDRHVIGSSPETLFSLQDGIVETYPIAGSRPRGATPEEDLNLEKELLASEKERAEHIMLVDLARNDIGKVCYMGSVKVPEFMYIEKYSHVQHIVSKVVGTLKRNYNAFDVLKAVFPAGTVSGAPKPMAMNVIELLEPFKRGPYAGGVGFFSANGDAEFAITIRSAFVNKDLFRIQAGAGIVYDSIPEMEYYETEHKMRALKVAMGVV